MPVCNYLKVEADKNLGNLATFRHYAHAQSVKYREIPEIFCPIPVVSFEDVKTEE